MKCNLDLCLRGTIDAVLILRRMQEEHHAKGKLYIVEDIYIYSKRKVVYVFCGPRESF